MLKFLIYQPWRYDINVKSQINPLIIYRCTHSKIEYLYIYMENSKQLQKYSEPRNLLEFKFDFSCAQLRLNQILADFQKKISLVQTQTHNIMHKYDGAHLDINEQLKQVCGRLHQIQNDISHKKSATTPKTSLKYHHNIQLSSSPSQPNQRQQVTVSPRIVEKTPTEVLDIIDKRVTTPVPPQKQEVKQIQLNESPPNTDRVCYTVRIRQTHETSDRQEKLTLETIDKKCYSMYAKLMQQLDKQITETRKNLVEKLNEISESTNNPLRQSKQVQKQDQPLKSNKSIQKPLEDLTKSKKTIKAQKSSKNIGTTEKNLSNTEKDEMKGDEKMMGLLDETLKTFKQEIKQSLQLQNQNTEARFQEVRMTNSTFADKMVNIIRTIEQLSNETDAMKIQVDSSNDKFSTSQKQISLLLENNTDNKNRIKSIENTMSKFRDDLKKCEQQVKLCQEKLHNAQNGHQESQKVSPSNSKRDIFQDSRSSFRDSAIANGLGPIRNSTIFKQNNNRIDGIEENIKLLSNKLSSLIDKFNRMEDQRKKFGDGYSGLLPKIDKQNSKSSSTNHIQIIRKDLKKVNEEILKTNQKLGTTKERLNNLYEEHSVIPNKIEDLYTKLREYNEFQEDRLIELIKELINRMLSDPFDNHFTNRLKRQINVKFLQIKHEYHGILKEIESKVQDRAQKSDMIKTSNKHQQSIAELKSLNSKKCDVEDFKKGIKYLENKIKQVYQYTKEETTQLHKEQKQYIGVKKQSFC